MAPIHSSSFNRVMLFLHSSNLVTYINTIVTGAIARGLYTSLDILLIEMLVLQSE